MLRRALTREVQGFPRREISAALVIVQDQYDGGNFAHMLFDWLPRLLHFAMHHPDLARRAMYLMGVAPVRCMTSSLSGCAKAWSGPAEYIFPLEHEVIVPRERVYFFSDQRQALMHPLLMGDPETVRLVRELLADCLPVPGDGPERLYISRGDAADAPHHQRGRVGGAATWRGLRMVRTWPNCRWLSNCA